ncbi:MAG: M3 family oligoendopeptidase [Phycisphaerales bacterium]|nr:M3 family oligoendopeptidase [Phycisphaerales bacterium]
MLKKATTEHVFNRNYCPSDFDITKWESTESLFTELINRPINSLSDLKKWLNHLSELETVSSELISRKYINYTRQTDNTELSAAFEFVLREIQPKLAPLSNLLNRKLNDCPFTSALPQDNYAIYLKNIKNSIELFREENIPLQSELSLMQMKFAAIQGQQMVSYQDKSYTIQQASQFLESADPVARQTVYYLIQERRKQDELALDELLSHLVQKRHTIANNAGFDNYIAYRFKELGRYDYTPESCVEFHRAVKKHIIPLVYTIYEEKKKRLNLSILRPWDLDGIPNNEEPLIPFQSSADLIDKSIQCFTAITPFFGECLDRINKSGNFDLESRKGKAPGGYNCSLPETGVPFIFMNISQSFNDMVTMMHEGGHAIHSFLLNKLDLYAFKSPPIEICEVASMSLELLSMSQWQVFFSDKNDLMRARKNLLERVITILPGIAQVDEFQHWLYQNPNHTALERKNHWCKLVAEYTPANLSLDGLEDFYSISWQKYIHIFEVPFYYIEYAIAQLGAIGIWKHYLDNPSKTIEQFVAGLSLGGTAPLPTLFEQTGVQFSFDTQHIQALVAFVEAQYTKL